MEKINTPLMALIEELYNARKAYIIMTGKANQFDRAIQIAESLLPTEREVIEKAFIAGDLRDRSELPDRYDDEPAQDYFTQTFKSYE